MNTYFAQGLFKYHVIFLQDKLNCMHTVQSSWDSCCIPTCRTHYFSIHGHKCDSLWRTKLFHSSKRPHSVFRTMSTDWKMQSPLLFIFFLSVNGVSHWTFLKLNTFLDLWHRSDLITRCLSAWLHNNDGFLLDV